MTSSCCARSSGAAFVYRALPFQIDFSGGDEWSAAPAVDLDQLCRAEHKRTDGVAPMDYLLHWRMALTKDLMRGDRSGVAEVAERVG